MRQHLIAPVCGPCFVCMCACICMCIFRVYFQWRWITILAGCWASVSDSRPVCPGTGRCSSSRHESRCRRRGNGGLDLTFFCCFFFYCSLQVSNTHWKVRGTEGDSLWQPFDADGQIFGHESSLNGLDADGLQGFREDSQLRVFVELRSVEETACPGEDGGCSWHRFYQLFALGI